MKSFNDALTRQSQRCLRLLSAVGVLGAALVGCGTDELDNTSSSTTPAQSPLITELVTPPPQQVSTPPSVSPNKAPAPVSTTPAAKPSVTPTTAPAKPPSVHPEQSGTFWTAVIAYSDQPNDQRLDAIIAELHDFGYDISGVTDLDSLAGAREQLLPELDPMQTYYVVSIPFANEANARQFERIVPLDIIGVAKIQHYAMD